MVEGFMSCQLGGTCKACKTKTFCSDIVNEILKKAREQDHLSYERLLIFFEEIENYCSDDEVININKNILKIAIDFGLDLSLDDSFLNRIMKYICCNDLLNKLDLVLDLDPKLKTNESFIQKVCKSAALYEAFNILTKLKDYGFDHRKLELCHEKNFRFMKWLCENVEIDQKTCNNYLMNQVSDHMELDIISLLILKGAEIENKDDEGRSPLHRLINYCEPKSAKSLEIMFALLDEGADIESVDNENATPLYTALKLGKTRIIYHLLDRGAKLGAPKIKELGPIFLIFLDCSKKFTFETYEMFFRYLIDINERDSEGQTCLHKIMCQFYESKHVKILLDLGADVNSQDSNGNTPSHILSNVSYENKKKLRMLIDKGADVYIKNNEGKTAFECLI